MPAEPPPPDTAPARRASIVAPRARDFRVPGTDSEGKSLTIPRSISFRGRIGYCERLLVEGVLETDIGGCRELTVAAGGIFRGGADVEVADIGGAVEGTLIVHRTLTLRASGRIVSESISYGELELERGGVLIGTLRPLVEHEQ